MKRNFLTGFVAGALIFGSIAAFSQGVIYQAEKNIYPVQLNGQNVSIDGYNIDGYTYFKLRDISAVVGGFDVDFQNDTILLSKDGYTYSTAPATNTELTADDAAAIAQSYYENMEKINDPYNEYDNYNKFIPEDCGTGKYYRVLGTFGGNFEVDYTTFYVSKETRTVVPLNADVIWNAIQGEWYYNDSDMEQQSISIKFNSDGTFSYETWRVYGVGTYSVTDANTIEVNYDIYFQGAGSSEYEYYYSTSETYELSGDVLIKNDGTVFGQPKG